MLSCEVAVARTLKPGLTHEPSAGELIASARRYRDARDRTCPSGTVAVLRRARRTSTGAAGSRRSSTPSSWNPGFLHRRRQIRHRILRLELVVEPEHVRGLLRGGPAQDVEVVRLGREHEADRRCPGDRPLQGMNGATPPAPWMPMSVELPPTISSKCARAAADPRSVICTLNGAYIAFTHRDDALQRSAPHGTRRGATAAAGCSSRSLRESSAPGCTSQPFGMQGLR